MSKHIKCTSIQIRLIDLLSLNYDHIGVISAILKYEVSFVYKAVDW